MKVHTLQAPLIRKKEDDARQKDEREKVTEKRKRRKDREAMSEWRDSMSGLSGYEML